MRAYDASLPSPPINQLWTINGGPGESASGIEYLGIWVSSNFMANNPVTIYAPDHRGTGLSSCLGNVQRLHPEIYSLLGSQDATSLRALLRLILQPSIGKRARKVYMINIKTIVSFTQRPMPRWI